MCKKSSVDSGQLAHKKPADQNPHCFEKTVYRILKKKTSTI